jgi:hypothetical protein
MYFDLSNGDDTSSLSSEYPQGTSLFSTSLFPRTIEIVPEQGSGRPDWAQLVIRIPSDTTDLRIRNVVLEVDRVNFTAQSPALVLGQEVLRGATEDDFLRLRGDSVYLQSASGSTSLGPARVQLQGALGDVEIDADAGVYEANFVGSVPKMLTGTNSIQIEDGVLEFYDAEPSTGSVLRTSIAPGQIDVVDRFASPDSVTSIAPETTTITRGDRVTEIGNLVGLLEDGLRAINSDTNVESILVSGSLTVSNISTTSTVIPEGITTTGTQGFRGVNAPSLLVKVSYNSGSGNWEFVSFFSRFGVVSFTGTNNSTGFSITSAGSPTFTYAFATGGKAGDNVNALASGSSVSIAVADPAVNLDVVSVMAY